MSKTYNAVPIAVLFAATMSGLAVAADLPKEGTYDLTVCQTRVLDRVMFSDTRSMSHYEQNSMALSNPPGGMFDKGASHCVGTATGVKGQPTDDMMFCITTYPDGGKVLKKFWLQPDGTYKMEVIEATGKYEGMVQTYTSKVTVSFPNAKPNMFQWCTQQTGTYKLK